MPNGKLTIGFVRRGYSASGGAEAYLKRLAQAIVARGHQVRLFTTVDWPEKEWSFGQMIRLRWGSPIGFANEFEKLRAQVHCNVIMSLERVWSCDVYRAGDGVHRAWLDRRKKFEPPWQRIFRRLSRKHEGMLRLERSLFADRKAERVIANSASGNTTTAAVSIKDVPSYQKLHEFTDGLLFLEENIARYNKVAEAGGVQGFDTADVQSMLHAHFAADVTDALDPHDAVDSLP